jgi:hypothetical protein
MKKNKIRFKYFTNNDEYFYFIKKENIKILSVEYTHNFKIKVAYVIIK